MMYRLAPHPDEWIDRSKVVHFFFEGSECQGYEGDTISSALLAAGLPFLGRGFKYHRPRSLLSFNNHDSNTLFQVGGIPNVRGDVTLVRTGMRVSAINTFGGLRQDKARILDRLSSFLPVGFYYKAFHSKRLFPRWERMFRALTGLGRVSLDAPRKLTAKRYAFCDVLVVGAGASGLAAALAAAAAGARVALVDESLQGGGITPLRAPNPALKALLQAVRQSENIAPYPSTVAAGYYADHWLALAEPLRMTKMRAKAVVFATGVIEQPAVFRNNDLPGVMLASAALRLLACYRIAPGRTIVMVAANREAYEACLALAADSLQVVAILELRSTFQYSLEDLEVARRCTDLGIKILTAAAPYQAIAASNGLLEAIDYVPIDSHGTINIRAAKRIECDCLLMSVGWAPASQLLSQAGGSTVFVPEIQQFVPKQLPAGVFAAGRLNGVFEFNYRVDDGHRAGTDAAAYAGFGEASGSQVARSTRCPSHPYPIVEHPDAKNFVDFDEDIQVKDLQNAIQEGFDSSELLKRYTTVGMGPSQGKHSNMNALRILARARSMSVAALGMTTARPMYHPVPLKLLAGRGFHPFRRTPADAVHGALGAIWMPAANWRRPEYYEVSGESRAASIEAEVRAVRHAVGLIDVGTLGKIEIYGPNAGEFLDRVYTGNFSNLSVGMTRYGLMLDESGVIMDDGVVARLDTDLFYFTTTTSGSTSVFRELLRLNALWGLECSLMNLTGHMAAFNFAGPLSREILQTLLDINLAESEFPFLGVRQARLCDVAARLMRVGFVGELAYEIHVAASDAVLVWKALTSAGKDRGLRPFGVEAQRVLRLEKGHFIVSQDTDGLTDPYEANAMWAVNMRKPFFVGQRSLRILEKRGPRQKLVGIEWDELDRNILVKESHLVIDGVNIAGRVTSAYYSATVQKWIGFAMLTPDFVSRRGGAPGRDVYIRTDSGKLQAARIASLPFYDPKNTRQKQVVGA